MSVHANSWLTRERERERGIEGMREGKCRDKRVAEDRGDQGEERWILQVVSH